ncbi:hypothetical protein F4561_005311 [Lipingzhangella halophila]|uniref:YcaO domain-containing protein n=1 Tax=Lipingzhangella halophila TaxID=1783352 RepID=A0A7W7RM43_9ACTN|nr:hypothetical protein [Lipingzhangella halophila]MBB4934491.1 hypothetical protein [Lipingzhangella halophila]
MKLVLRSDVYRASTAEGLRVLTHHGLVAFSGVSIAAWLDRLEPYLDGRFGLDDLTANLGDGHKRMLEQVIEALVGADIVREVEDLAPVPADPPGDDAPERQYLEYFLDTAAATWRRYRECDALVIGRGALAAAVAHACARSGITRVRTALPDEPMNGHVRDSGIVLHVTEDADLALARWLRDVCAAPGAILGHAADLGDHAVIGPVGSETRDWESAWRRMLALRRADSAPSGQPPDSADHAVVANQLVHRAFRAHTGIADDAERDRVTRVTYDTLETTHHTVLPHPATRPATAATRARFTNEVRTLRRGTELTAEEMSRRTAPLVDGRTGVFGALDQRDFAQFPLHVSEATVSDPMGLAGGPVRVVGAGPDYATARYRTAMRGYAAYGALAVDPRQLSGRGPGTPDDLLAALRRGHASGRVWGYGLADGQVHALDAARAFPALADGAGAGLPVRGSAAGYTWEHAVRDALLDHCRALATSGLDAWDEPVPLVDVGAVALDQETVHYHALLCATGRTVEVYDLTRLLTVPCVLVRDSADTGVCGVGASTAEALRDGLERALLAYQSASYGDPAYAPPRVAVPRERLRGAVPSALDDTVLTVDGLVAALRPLGYAPVAVPLDHDREVARRVPFLIQVVLDHD